MYCEWLSGLRGTGPKCGAKVPTDTELPVPTSEAATDLSVDSEIGSNKTGIII